jgi:hypothetical protein
MIAIHTQLAARLPAGGGGGGGPAARLVLQIHDEFLLEVPGGLAPCACLHLASSPRSMGQDVLQAVGGGPSVALHAWGVCPTPRACSHQWRRPAAPRKDRNVRPLTVHP